MFMTENKKPVLTLLSSYYFYFEVVIYITALVWHARLVLLTEVNNNGFAVLIYSVA